MEKFQRLNMVILEDDGTSHLKDLMKDITKEILLEMDDTFIKQKAIQNGMDENLVIQIGKLAHHRRYVSQDGNTGTQNENSSIAVSDQ